MTPSFQEIFGDSEGIFLKYLKADESTKIVESLYDWSIIESIKNIDDFLRTSDRNKGAELCITALVPEVTKTGFSMIGIDRLDLLILENLKHSITIRELMVTLRNYFDEDEIESAEVEFQSLIFGRLNRGLQFKLINNVH